MKQSRHFSPRSASGAGLDRRIKRRVSYGLGLLLLALSVGLAAALFLTVGTANADVFLVGTIAAF